MSHFFVAASSHEELQRLKDDNTAIYSIERTNKSQDQHLSKRINEVDSRTVLALSVFIGFAVYCFYLTLRLNAPKL